jgi:hypothetical protein
MHFVFWFILNNLPFSRLFLLLFLCFGNEVVLKTPFVKEIQLSSSREMDGEIEWNGIVIVVVNDGD